MAGIRSQAGKLGVTGQRRDEEDRQVRGHDDRERLGGLGHPEHQEHDGGDRQARPETRGEEGAAGEGENEREQVEGQRKDPEERHGRHVGGQHGGHPEHQAGRGGGERHPPQTAPGPRSRGFGFRRRVPVFDRDRGRRSPDVRGASEREHQVDDVARGPADALPLEPEGRLYHDRIRGEGQQAPHVARRVEEIGIGGLGPSRSAQPRLEKRRTRGEDEEGKPDGQEERFKEPERRGQRSGARGAFDEPKGEHGEGHDQQHRVDRELRSPRSAADPVRVGVAGKKGGLEEEHTGRPRGGRAADPRQHHLRDQGLHGEEKTGPDRDRGHPEHAEGYRA